MRRPGGARTAMAVAIALALVNTVGATTVADAKDGSARPSITVVNQNVLHGDACASDTDRCHLGDRMALLARNLARAHCPQVVALEETNRALVKRLRRPLAKVCGGNYRVVVDDDPGLDREVVLSTLPVLGSERVRLAGPLRTALWVRVKAAVGGVDVVATHLASGSDDRPCDPETCPPPCQADDSLNACQGRQAADLLDARRTTRTVGVLLGDLNATPTEPTIAALRARGLIDTHLAAGNAECDPASGAQCTSGRVDENLDDMKNPASRETERVDYVFLAPSSRCRITDPTGLFGATPAKHGPGGLAYASDHTGATATISCRTTRADLAAAKRIRTRTTTTTTTGTAAVPAEERAEITQAFETLFGGAVSDPDAKLAAVEDADQLRGAFLARLQSVGVLATRTGVRMESFAAAGPEAVDVVYTITLDGNPVLDQLPGRAVKIDGHWVVSRRTYCQVATLGTDTAPAGCA